MLCFSAAGARKQNTATEGARKRIGKNIRKSVVNARQ